MSITANNEAFRLIQDGGITEVFDATSRTTSGFKIGAAYTMRTTVGDCVVKWGGGTTVVATDGNFDFVVADGDPITVVALETSIQRRTAPTLGTDGVLIIAEVSDI